MYISEWTYNNQQTSNIRVTTKVSVHSLLSDSSVLQEYGSAIVHNLACKEVKTVVCIFILVDCFYLWGVEGCSFSVFPLKKLVLCRLVCFPENVQKFPDKEASTQRQFVQGSGC